MFKLIRLAIYALVGYAAYTFVMDVIQLSEQEKTPQRGRGKTGGRAAARLTGAKRGGGTGKAVATEDSDGVSRRHRVGRGVV